MAEVSGCPAARASATGITVAGGATIGVLVASDNGQWVNAGDLTHGSTTVVIEAGTGLSAWPDSYPAPDAAAAANPGVTVVKDSPTGFDTVTLTLSQAADPTQLARLKVTVTP